VDLTSAAGANASSISWGPYILFALGILFAAGAWAIRRTLARIDAIGERMQSMSERVAVIETKQDLTTEIADSTDKNVRKAARKVGVLPRELENTVDRRGLAAR